MNKSYHGKSRSVLWFSIVRLIERRCCFVLSGLEGVLLLVEVGS